MKKVITFCIWGNNPTYNVGAIRNAELSLQFYPDYECWFYVHVDSVPQDTIEKLRHFNHTKIIFKSGDLNTIKPTMWRFEAIDDPEVEIMMSRDTDSRFLLREKLAVDEWLNSNTLFHIMRDHPEHQYIIQAGMFGTKKISEIPSWTDLMNTFEQYGDKFYDQDFLLHYIYPKIINNSTIHASFNKLESHAKNFPIDFCIDYKFVGEYVYCDESSPREYRDIIKKCLNM